MIRCIGDLLEQHPLHQGRVHNRNVVRKVSKLVNQFDCYIVYILVECA